MRHISLLFVALTALWMVSDAGLPQTFHDSFIVRHWASAFWHQKMTTFFKGLDIDGNGDISAGDFRKLGDAVSDIQGANNMRRMKLKSLLANTFKDNFKDISGSKNQFIKAMRKMIKGRTLNKWATEVLTSFFKAVDSDGDNFLQEAEYKTVYTGLFKDATLAGKSFKNIDSNKDGKISLVEYIYNGKDFFTSENKKSDRSKYFWGPLAKINLF